MLKTFQKKIFINSDEIFKLLIFFFPALIVYGPFLPDLIVSIVAIYFLVLLLIRYSDIKYYFHSNFFKLFLAIYSFMIISSLLSVNTLLSLESSLFYVRFPIFALAIWYFINTDENFIKKFSYFFVIIYSFILIDSFITHLTDYGIFRNQRIDDRLSGLFGIELRLGSYLTRLFPIFCFCIYRLSDSLIKLRFLSVFIFPLFFLITLLSGERTAVFFLFSFCSLSIFILFFNFKYKILLIFSGILFIFIIFVYEPYLYERIVLKTINQIFNEDKIFIFSNQHQLHYLSSIKIFFDHPVIGAGPKIFRELCSNPLYYLGEYTCSTHPHNSYIQVLSELGLIGIIFLCFIFFKIYSILIKNLFFLFSRSSQPYLFEKTFLLISIAITLWPFAPTNNLFNNWINCIYFLPVGFYLYYKKQQEL